LRAAIRLASKASKITMYEPPYNNDPGAQESWSQYLRQLREALAEGRRGDAVAPQHRRASPASHAGQASR
jgi:hypothetical protein